MNDTSVREEMAKAIAKVASGAGSMQDKLIAIRRQRDLFLPADVTAVMDRAIADLERSNKRASALRPGDELPAFELSDLNGARWSAKDLLREGPLVVIFYRGGWCPYCNIQLHGIQGALPRIEAFGATVLAIAPELPMRQDAMKQRFRLTFPLLHDEGNRVARTFGIVDTLPPDLLAVYHALGHGLADVNGVSGASNLPLPATFVSDPEGKIRFAHVEEDYARRVSPDDILTALQRGSTGP